VALPAENCLFLRITLGEKTHIANTALTQKNPPIISPIAGLSGTSTKKVIGISNPAERIIHQLGAIRSR